MSRSSRAPKRSKDPDCVHVAALDHKGETIGTGRMMADGHIGRMAVMPPWRGRGVGTAVLHELLAIAKESRLPQVDLDGQIHAARPPGEHYVRHMPAVNAKEEFRCTYFS